MSAESHVIELKKKHQILSEQIESEVRSPGSSDLDIASLKKRKLMLKDEIERFTSH